MQLFLSWWKSFIICRTPCADFCGSHHLKSQRDAGNILPQLWIFWLWCKIHSRLIGLPRDHCRDSYAIMRNWGAVPIHSALSPLGASCNYSCGDLGEADRLKRRRPEAVPVGRLVSRAAEEPLLTWHTLPGWQECQCTSQGDTCLVPRSLKKCSKDLQHMHAESAILNFKHIQCRNRMYLEHLNFLYDKI